MKTMRWIARALSTLFAAVWLFIMVVSAASEPVALDAESVVMLVLTLLATGSVSLAWVRELEGGLALVAVGIAHCIFALITAGHNRGLALLISGVPFLIPGGLFTFLGLRSRKRGTAESDLRNE